MGPYYLVNCKLSKLSSPVLILFYYSFHSVMAFIQYRLGSIHLVNEEFEKAQQHFQHCLATRKDAHGMMDKSTQQTQQVLVVAIRLAGKLQHAKEILETAQEEVQKTSAIVDNVGECS